MKFVNVHFFINPLNAKLNPTCHLLALFGAHHILHVSRIRINSSNSSKLYRRIPGTFWSYYGVLLASLMMQEFKKTRIVTRSSGLSMAANSALKAQFRGIILLVTTPFSIGSTNKCSWKKKKEIRPSLLLSRWLVCGRWLGAFWTQVNAFYAMFCLQQQHGFHEHQPSVYYIFDGSFRQGLTLQLIEFYGLLYARVISVSYWLVPNAPPTVDALSPARVLEITLSFPNKPISFLLALMGTAVVSLV